MQYPAILTLTLSLLMAVQTSSAKMPASRAQWGQWCGPHGTGVAPAADPPIHWSEKENIKWKAPAKGKGLSSPVIWGNQIFITTAVPDQA